jgi:uncharacterized protein with von Willebrand factor type A (vWA) domain
MSLELKKGDQIIIAVDTSGSMNERDVACGNTTKYAWMQETLASYVKGASRFDPDGVSVYFFSSNVQTYTDVSTPEQAIDLAKKHKTGGGTNTHLALEAAWKEHASKRNQSTYLLVFTDGDASDRQALADEIVSITKRVNDPEEFRIVFLPVGTPGPDLSNFLDYLDEGLTGAKYDIVAVVRPDEADFESALANAIDGTTNAGDVADGHANQGKKTTSVS